MQPNSTARNQQHISKLLRARTNVQALPDSEQEEQIK